MAAGRPLSPASQLLHLIGDVAQIFNPAATPVGAGLPAMAVVQPQYLVAGRPLSPASRLLHLIGDVAQILNPAAHPL